MKGIDTGMSIFINRTVLKHQTFRLKNGGYILKPVSPGDQISSTYPKKVLHRASSL